MVRRASETLRWTSAFAALAASFLGLGALPATAADERGARLYQERCAGCHDSPRERTPSRQVIAGLPYEVVMRSMTVGSMRAQAAELDRDSIAAIADFLREGAGGAPADRRAEAGQCADAAGPLDPPAAGWNGWGRDLENSRFQPDPGLKAEDVPRLKLKWAFGYPGTLTYGQPAIVGDRLFVTSMTGKVYSLNARNGCTYWTFSAEAAVRTAIMVGAHQAAIGKAAVYFGDGRANVYALDAQTGAMLWKQRVDTHFFARITGAPVLHRGRLLVPVSSAEEAASQSPAYECCTFRGALAALDAETGAIVWKTHTIAEAAAPYRVSSTGTQMRGPAGAAIWSSPTVDNKRGLIYVGTGNSYTEVSTSTSDAILAFALETGELKWARQATPNDNYLIYCGMPPGSGTPGRGTCPTPIGPDFDFGASPILRTLKDGRDIIVAGQKSGMVYGLDPDKLGAIIWQARVGDGGVLGGVEWGPAADAVNVYAAVADIHWGPQRAAGSLTALSLETGERVWHRPAPAPKCSWGADSCTTAQSAAVTAMPGVVFSGSLDGHLRAYAIADGAIVWDADTAQQYETINGVVANGGSLDAGGATIAGGMLYVNSGYGRFAGKPGNALLAFSIDGM
jgi:polyvinyl alcohol dehydrogenase (cytochrome)